MKKIKIAIIGTGFWANYQVPAWFELENVEIVAVYNRSINKALELAGKYSIPSVYDDIDLLFKEQQPDLVDIITDVDTHAMFTSKAVKNGVGVICQKPMAPTLQAAAQMVKLCADAGVPFFIHENWRWQTPLRTLNSLLKNGAIGEIFKARVTFCSAFPVILNQPFLAELEQFILTDIGSHILDTCRFLFGEVDTLYCQTASVNPDIKGEDVANVLMKMRNGISCYAEMSYSSILEHESFPQTYVLVEGSEGSIHLAHNYEIRITTRGGTQTLMAPPPTYSWAADDYLLTHSSIVDCNREILASLINGTESENSGFLNFETVKLVHASYASANENKLVHISSF